MAESKENLVGDTGFEEVPSPGPERGIGSEGWPSRGPIHAVIGLGQRRGAVTHHFMWTIEFRTKRHRQEDMPRLEAVIRREQLEAMHRLCDARGISRDGIEKLLDEGSLS
jgi:hypothetical protein